MDIQSLPTLDDDGLANIRSNAQRLLIAGTPKQQAAAAALIPAIEAECAARAAAKVSRRNEALATRRAARDKGARNSAASGGMVST